MKSLLLVAVLIGGIGAAQAQTAKNPLNDPAIQQQRREMMQRAERARPDVQAVIAQVYDAMKVRGTPLHTFEDAVKGEPAATFIQERTVLDGLYATDPTSRAAIDALKAENTRALDEATTHRSAALRRAEKPSASIALPGQR